MSKKQSKQPKDLPTYNTGDPVLGKIRGYPPWPGIVIDPSDAPPNVINQQPTNKKATAYCVLFFPHGDYGWLGPKELSLLRPHEVEAFLADGQKRNAELKEGYRIAQNPAVWMSNRAATDAAAREAEEEAQVDQLQSDGEAGADGAEGEEGSAAEEGMDLDVGLGLEAPKKKRKPTASASKKRKRESDVATLSAAGTPATTDAKPTKAAAAVKPKKAPTESKAKKAPVAEKEKKPRKNGSAKNKVAVESEDEMAGAAGAGDETDAAGGSSKKDTGGSPPPAKKVRREKEDEDDSKSGDPQSVKVRDWRHKLQKTFLSNKGAPKSEAMAELDALFTTVEQYEEMTIEQLQFSKIGKVMRHIAALPEDKIPPRDAEFGFRSRARALVDKWHRILNANKLGGNGTAGGHASPVSAAPPPTAEKEKEKVNGENGKEEGKTVEEGVGELDLNGKAESPAVAEPTTEAPAAATTTTAAAADVDMELSTTTPAVIEPAAKPLSTGAAADAEGEQDQDANAEAEDASTHVEDVVMTEA